MRHGESGRSRRRFLGEVGATAGMLAVAGAGLRTAGATEGQGATVVPGVVPTEWFPRQDPKLVEQVVALAHRDLEGVRQLVTKRPELAKAQWDWGYGDWESPLDAASHMGLRDMALLLLEHGARPTIFSAAMLGQLDVVRGFVIASPGIQSTPGPHGIPLLAHAKVGGESAATVVAYLEKLGGADGGPRRQLTEAEAQHYLGTYRWGAATGDLLEVTFGRFGLSISRGGGANGRPLVPLGEHAFHPAGAPSVRVRFEGAGERAAAVAIYDPDLLVRGSRAS